MTIQTVGSNVPSSHVLIPHFNDQARAFMMVLCATLLLSTVDTYASVPPSHSSASCSKGGLNGPYLPLAGGTMSGTINFDDDVTDAINIEASIDGGSTAITIGSPTEGITGGSTGISIPSVIENSTGISIAGGGDGTIGIGTPDRSAGIAIAFDGIIDNGSAGITIANTTIGSQFGLITGTGIDICGGFNGGSINGGIGIAIADYAGILGLASFQGIGISIASGDTSFGIQGDSIGIQIANSTSIDGTSPVSGFAPATGIAIANGGGIVSGVGISVAGGNAVSSAATGIQVGCGSGGINGVGIDVGSEGGSGIGIRIGTNMGVGGSDGIGLSIADYSTAGVNGGAVGISIGADSDFSNPGGIYDTSIGIRVGSVASSTATGIQVGTSGDVGPSINAAGAVIFQQTLALSGIQTVAASGISGTVQINPGITTLLITGSSGPSSATIDLPTSPSNGQLCTIASSAAIGVLTISGTHTVNYTSPASLVVGSGIQFIYSTAGSGWYQIS